MKGTLTKKETAEFNEFKTALCTRIFDGKVSITSDEYFDFRNNLIETQAHYEFHQCDRDRQGLISK